MAEDLRIAPKARKTAAASRVTYHDASLASPRRPPLSLDHACVGRIFTVYRCIRVYFFVCFRSPFDLDVLSPSHALLFHFLHFPTEHRRTVPSPSPSTRSTPRTLRLSDTPVSSFTTPCGLSLAIPSSSLSFHFFLC